MQLIFNSTLNSILFLSLLQTLTVDKKIKNDLRDVFAVNISRPSLLSNFRTFSFVAFDNCKRWQRLLRFISATFVANDMSSFWTFFLFTFVAFDVSGFLLFSLCTFVDVGAHTETNPFPTSCRGTIAREQESYITIYIM